MSDSEQQRTEFETTPMPPVETGENTQKDDSNTLVEDSNNSPVSDDNVDDIYKDSDASVDENKDNTESSDDDEPLAHALTEDKDSNKEDQGLVEDTTNMDTNDNVSENPAIQDENVVVDSNTAIETTKSPNQSETSETSMATMDNVSNAQEISEPKTLIEKQIDYVMQSKMLSLPEFKSLTDREKVTAILNLLNSNDDTKMPIQKASNVNNPIENKHIEPKTNTPAGSSASSNQKNRPPKYFRTDLSEPMSPEEQERYSIYLRGENKITEMHNIPPKSRLFIGNLPLKNVSKEDLFRIFSPFGYILQINIKNAFGFIQYDNPSSVKKAIEWESDQINFGKKLILEVSSSNSRPQYDHGDHGTNSSSTFISSAKRPFHNDDNDSFDSKKAKIRVPPCVIYVKKTADRGYANDFFNNFRRATGLETDMFFLRPKMDLKRMMNDAAYEGVWGAIIVNKNRNVDVQTFYKSPHGDTKFDEYIGLSLDDTINLFNNIKAQKNGVQNGPGRGYPTQPQSMSMGSQQQYDNRGPPMQSGNYYGNHNDYNNRSSRSQQNYGQQQPPYGQTQQPYNMQPMNQMYNQQPPIPTSQMGGYDSYQGNRMSNVAPPPPQQQQPQPAAAPMDQQQLFSVLQNLPPDMVSNLLSMAQQQQQQQQPHAQQKLLNMIQSMQTQQQQPSSSEYPPQGNQGPPMQQQYGNQQGSSLPRTEYGQSSSYQQQQPQNVKETSKQQQQDASNNVQNLLDSLAKLQK